MATQLGAELEAFLEVEPLGQPIELDPLTVDQINQLEALGYLQRKGDPPKP